MHKLLLKTLGLPFLRNRLSPISAYLLIICFNLMNTGCGSKVFKINKNTKYFAKFPEESTIDFNNICEYKYGVAGTLLLADSTLIILNEQPAAKYFLNNYSLESDNLSKGYFSKGMGPGQAMGIMMAGVINNFLWLQDVVQKKIFTIQKSDINSTTNLVFKENSYVNQFYMIDFKDSLHYFGVGDIHSEYKIQEINLINGEIINEYGKIENTPKDISIPLFKSAYQTFILTRPSGDKIVLPYRFMDAIEIYDTKTKSSIAVQGPDKYNVEYQPKGNQMIKTKKTRIAFVHGTVTNNYIYLSYSGKKRYSPDYYFGNKIFVYDWEGHPIKKFNLKNFIQGLVVTPDDKFLYAFDAKTGFLMKAKIN